MTTPNRYYSSTAIATTLAAPALAADSTITVAATTGFPSLFPYTLVIDAGNSLQEIVSVTSASGNVLNVSRGQDGSAGVGHSNGATVTHDVSARDYSEPAAHINALQGVHGVSGAFVDTVSSQALANKILNSPTINTPTIASPTITNPIVTGASFPGGISGLTLTQPAIADFTLADHNHTSAATGGQLDVGAWTALPFQTGWQTSGGVQYPAAYRVVSNTVQLRGAVMKTSGNPTTNTQTLVATLPVGARPASEVAFSTCTVGQDVPDAVYIDTSGNVYITVSFAHNTIGLDSIFFFLV